MKKAESWWLLDVGSPYIAHQGGAKSAALYHKYGSEIVSLNMTTLI